MVWWSQQSHIICKKQRRKSHIHKLDTLLIPTVPWSDWRQGETLAYSNTHWKHVWFCAKTQILLWLYKNSMTLGVLKVAKTISPFYSTPSRMKEFALACSAPAFTESAEKANHTHIFGLMNIRKCEICQISFHFCQRHKKHVHDCALKCDFPFTMQCSR